METFSSNGLLKNSRSKKSDSCGCAMGARVMAAAFIISLVFYGWQVHAGLVTTWGLIWRVVAAVFIGAGLGKLAGIGIYQLRKHLTQ